MMLLSVNQHKLFTFFAMFTNYEVKNKNHRPTKQVTVKVENNNVFEIGMPSIIVMNVGLLQFVFSLNNEDDFKIQIYHWTTLNHSSEFNSIIDCNTMPLTHMF